MLNTPTPFPCAGSYALLTIRDRNPVTGRYAASRTRRVRIQQVRPDRRFLVTADAARVPVGRMTVVLPPIQKTVDRADLRPAPASPLGHAA